MQHFSESQAIKPSSPLPCSHSKVLAFQEEEEQRAVVGRSRRTGTGRPFQAVQYASIHRTAPRDGPFSYDPAAFPQHRTPRADHQLSTGMRSRIEVMPGARSWQCWVVFFASLWTHLASLYLEASRGICTGGFQHASQLIPNRTLPSEGLWRAHWEVSQHFCHDGSHHNMGT